ncbi:endonuclease VII domain-containing protein [Streptomyces sp. NRRL B-24720]|uniref:endonuclease VII domain-containing protein n=1 Tax=Streptomyces sp. NRRL B-24720 TaxID=1476876 RepID=UPI000562B5CB
MTSEERRARDLRNKYGITPEQYDQLLEAQGGLCAICRGPQRGRRPVLAIDHCHESGLVRALLCDYCNFKVGIYENSRVEVEEFLGKYGQGNSLLYGLG